MLRAAGADVVIEDAGTPVTVHGELPARRVTVEPAAALEPGADHGARRLLLRGLLDRRRAAGPRQRGPARERRHQPGADRPARDPDPDGRRDRGRRDGGGGARAGGDDRRPLGAAARRAGERRRGAAGDRRAAPGRPGRLLRRGRDGRLGRRGAAPQGVGPDRDRGRRPGRARRRDRGDRGRLRGQRNRGLARRSARRGGDHRLAMLGAIAGLASRRRGRGGRVRGGRGQLPGVRRATCGGCSPRPA